MKTADVIIIGGGIAGIGAASRIAPEASVVILEMEDAPARHATGRSAAIYIRNYGNATLRALNVASEPVLAEPEGISDSSLLTPRGEMIVADEAGVASLESYLEGSDGLERLDASEAIELFPLLRRDWVQAAAFEKAAQDIDVDRLLQGFLKLARRHGAELVTNAAVTCIQRHENLWQIETPAGRFQAPVVINAAGAWADQVAALAKVDKVGLSALRRSAAIIAPPAGLAPNHWPLVASAAEDWYIKPDAGKFMVSPADEDPVEPHDAWPDDMVLAEGIYRAEQAVDLQVKRLEHTWAGLRTFAPDRTPVVGFAPEVDGFLWLGGQGGYGVQTAPALSQLAADLCLGKCSSLSSDILDSLHPIRFQG
ncbi:FAD-binding oxidoreductase [Labrenzia sp. CE80]|uniref:NAD(P)/FAD-dependent oxidoreductase n=1 Tax=Labrenzia sp. CE80 TaxID=1788986 RepID=UPI00129BC54D|nr:FAD-binding oxidoreductase [Labrenzia sp. CE80]